ncbi:beta-eliminating lyase-related protein [Shigella flexneri]
MCLSIYYRQRHRGGDAEYAGRDDAWRRSHSGSRSDDALAESVKNIFGYQYTIPTHQGRGAEQIYIPVLIKKREQEKVLLQQKVAFSNHSSYHAGP